MIVYLLSVFYLYSVINVLLSVCLSVCLSVRNSKQDSMKSWKLVLEFRSSTEPFNFVFFFCQILTNVVQIHITVPKDAKTQMGLIIVHVLMDTCYRRTDLHASVT